MYIDMDTKSIIIPKGKHFTKNGKKIEDQYLLKYNKNKLANKWNIYPAKEINKKQEQYWIKTKIDYKEQGGVVSIKYTWKQKYTLEELKEIRIKYMQNAYEVYFRHWRAITDAKVFFENIEHDNGTAIKAAYNADKAAIMNMTKYQDIIDYQIMQTLNNDEVE
jgi:hypothetical protein